MKKILFVSTRDPYSKRFSGDVIGSKKIIDILKKNNELDLVTLGSKEDLSQKNIFIFKKPILLLKIINVVKSLFFLRPLQFGLFYSNKMESFIQETASNYDLIFFIISERANTFQKIIMEKK